MGHPYESYLISVVRPMPKTTREERLALIQAAHYNLFQLPAQKVSFDLLTDSGTGAISNQQLAELVTGDESYAGSASFEKLKHAVAEITGFPHMLPTHQGRAAENVLCSALVKAGDIIPGNAHFDTTKGHIEFRKATAVNCTIAESRDPQSPHPFKGDLDLAALEAVLQAHPRERIPFVLITVTCNTVGGQPVALANLQATKALCKKYGVRCVIDMARFAENAYFIKTREPKYSDWSIRRIARAMFDGTDGATMSAKKDGLAAMGGFLALRDAALYQQCCVYGVLFEGFITYGGMTGGTMAEVTQGLYEATELEYLDSRIGQVMRFAERLRRYGVPMVEPTGGHAVFIDAGRFLPQIPAMQYPAQALAVAAYIEGGIRGVEVGTVMADRDPATGKERHPAVELMRLAIPRRTFTDNHLAYVAQVFGDLIQRRNEVRGLQITWEAPVLRHFTCRFQQV